LCARDAKTRQGQILKEYLRGKLDAESAKESLLGP